MCERTIQCTGQEKDMYWAVKSFNCVCVSGIETENGNTNYKPSHQGLKCVAIQPPFPNELNLEEVIVVLVDVQEVEQPGIGKKVY